MKRVLLITLFSFVFALALTGCGSSTSTPPFQATGTSATVQMGDATNDQIAKLELTISAITLTGVSPTANTGNLLAKTAEFEFVHTAGTLEPLTLANIPPGTYSGATFTFTGAEIVVINGTTPTKVPATLSSNTANLTFTTNVTVGTTPLFLNFDLDLTKSVTLNGTPITSATVTPTFTVTTATTPPAGNEGNEDDHDGECDDVHGSVTNITAPNFTIQTNSGTSITFATNANTKFNDGLKQLSDLSVGDVVEVDAQTQSDGTKLATKIERESDNKGKEVEGLVSALDSPLTTITIAHQSDSSGDPNPPVTVAIGVNASTVYSVRSDKLSVTGTFDATHIGKGQRIEADVANSTATPIVATKVKLREQALLGTVAASPAPTSTSFTLTVSTTSAFGQLSGATSVVVTKANGATFQVTPTAGATIRVRGLVFVSGTTYTMTATKGDNND